MKKQREDSADLYKKGGRQELFETEEAEIKTIDTFLPKQLSEEETSILCDGAIANTEAKSLKEIGKVIKFLKENGSSNLDISLASKILKEKLQK